MDVQTEGHMVMADGWIAKLAYGDMARSIVLEMDRQVVWRQIDRCMDTLDRWIWRHVRSYVWIDG